MPRPEKVAAVSEIKDRLSSAPAVFLAEYSGLSVKAQQSLRRSLKAQGAEFQVVKMTLARRAAAELELADLDELLVGPTGLAYAGDDAVAAAKVLKDFATANDVFVIKGGLLGTTMLSPERIRQLADLPPRDVLLARLAGLFKAPAATMAGLLAALPRGAATMFQALLDKRSADAAGSPEAAEPESPAAPAAEPGTDADAEATDVPLPEAAGEAVEPEPPAEAESDQTDEAPQTTDDTAAEAEEET